MKRLIYILVVVSLVVSISGCTSDEWATNKTYSSNGIIFVYPGSWDVNVNKSITFPSDSVKQALVGTSDEILGVGTINGQNLTNDQLQETINSVVSDYKNQGYGSEKNITVDGVTATIITSQKAGSDGFYTSFAAWVKSGTIYYVVYMSKSNSTANLERLLGTFKTT